MTFVLGGVHLGYLGTGLGITYILGFRSNYSWLRRQVIAYLAGLVFQVGILYCASAIGPVPHLLSGCLSLAGLALFVGFSVTSVYRWSRDSERKASLLLPRFVHRQRKIFWIRFALLILLLLPLFTTYVISVNVPLYGWDGIAIWATKAQGLYNGESLKSQFFVNPVRVNEHRGYPIGYPLFLFQHAVLRGGFDDAIVPRASCLILIVWLVGFFDVVGEFSGATSALAACVILMYTPIFFVPRLIGSPLTGFADFPLAALISIGAGWFNSWLIMGRHADLFGAVCALTAVAGVKNEGLLWTSLILGLGVVSILVVRRAVGSKELIMLGIPVIALAAMRYGHRHLPTSSPFHIPSLGELAGLLPFFPRLADIAIGSILGNDRFLSLLPLFILIGYGMSLPRQWRNRYAFFALVGPVLVSAVFVVLGLIGVENGNLNRYYGVTYPRLLLQIAPVSLYWAIILNSPHFPLRSWLSPTASRRDVKGTSSPYPARKIL